MHFMKTLAGKDKQILEMRMEGYTLEEIADKLGYANHSGVLKRIRKVGQAYEKFTGVDYGFYRQENSFDTPIDEKSVGVFFIPENKYLSRLCTSGGLTSQGFSEVFYHFKGIYT